MKKTLILTAALVCIISLLLASCGVKKQPITQEAFIGKAQAAGLQAIDTTQDNRDYAEIKSAAEAYQTESGSETRQWTAEFYVLTDSDTAKKMFETNMEDIKNKKNDDDLGGNTFQSNSNYSIYEQTSGDSYAYVAYVDNTLLFVDSKTDYSETIIDFIKSIGYYM